MSEWTREPDLEKLQGLREPGPREMGGPRVADRMRTRERVATTPEARLGIAVADLAVSSSVMNDAGLVRMMPAFRTAHLPSMDPRLSVSARMSNQRATEERSAAHDGRWDGIAQTAASDARVWIATGTNLGIDKGHGLPSELQREVRRTAVDAVASKGPSIDETKPLNRQYEAEAEPVMKRVALFMSMGPDIEAAIDSGARKHAGAPGEAAELAKGARADMAAARVGALTPKQIVEASQSIVLSDMDELTPGNRPMAKPSFAHRFTSVAERDKAIAAALSSPEKPVPAKWSAEAQTKTIQPASKNAAIAMAMQAGRSRT